jgi:uncharacterized protein (TIRG00374 family)
MGSQDKASILKKGLVVFTAVSFLAMAGILIWTTKKETWTHFSDFRPIFIPVLLGLSILRWFLDGMTLKCMAGVDSQAALGLRRATVIRLEGNMVANVLPFFLGIFSTHAYLLHKQKMAWSQSTAVSMMRAVMPIFLFLGGIPVLFLMRSDPGSGKFFEKFIQAVSLPVAAVIVAGAVALFFPHWIKKAVSGLLKWGGKIKPLHAVRFLALEERLFREIDQFSLVMWSYMREKKRFALAMGFWIMAAFLADSLVAISILWGLGYTPPIWRALAVQFLIWPIAYIAPVPGGVGVLEFSYLGFFSLHMPQALTGAAVLLWRLLLTYLPAAAGMYFLIREVENDPKLNRLLQGKEKVPA